jgi:hypothetical protein
MSAINQTIEWSLMLQTLLRGGDSAEGKVLDLSEITIVDADVIRFLSVIEREGTRLMGCPPYVREWILRERAQEGV